MTKPSVIIVGGGICGLLAATVLQRRGLTITVLDKGRGIGGRLASRRLRHDKAVGCFDFGTQYFKAQAPQFQVWVEEWIAAGIVTVWSEGMPTESGEDHSPGVQLYRGQPSNRSIAQHLAKDLNVINQERVVRLDWQDQQWHVGGESGRGYQADYLVLTPPLPQTLFLLEASAIALPRELHHGFQEIRYAPCITLLALLEKPSQIPEPGGLWLAGEPLAWIACNTQKGISPDGYGVTIQAGPAFSQIHLETNPEDVTALMLTAADSWLGSPVLATHLHRWRYSHPLDFYDESFGYGELPGPIYFGGDAFLQGKVEGAALSGLAIADDLLAKVNAQSGPIFR
ncbi:MAG: FAD-dependent oxidoreductase [Synechocystis sp.]|nr:FAD-dependent oxidoreductase [Synechocystis sp.]